MGHRDSGGPGDRNIDAMDDTEQSLELDDLWAGSDGGTAAVDLGYFQPEGIHDSESVAGVGEAAPELRGNCWRLYRRRAQLPDGWRQLHRRARCAATFRERVSREFFIFQEIFCACAHLRTPV